MHKVLVGLALGMVVAGCASDSAPCISAADCPSNMLCSDSFSCRPASEQLAIDRECAPADSVGGIRAANVEHGRFRGDVGPFRGLSGDACDIGAFREGRDLWVNTVIPTQHGPSMTIVAFKGGLNRPDLVPGRTITFHGTTDVTVNGCAAYSASNWNFDEEAEEVTITVEEAPDGAWIYSYMAKFPRSMDPDYGTYEAHSISGSFRVVR